MFILFCLKLFFSYQTTEIEIQINSVKTIQKINFVNFELTKEEMKRVKSKVNLI